MFFRNKKVEIVSLGQNCIPRVILTRNGLKPKKWMGELTLPFDLAVFGVFEVTKSIKSNFSEFFDDLVFKDENGQKCWVKEPECIRFIHGKKLNSIDKEELIATYQKRFQNFRTVINDPKPVLFVQIISSDEDIVNLYYQILKLRFDKPFKIAIIDTQDVVKDCKIQDVSILKLPFPSEDYKNNWWKRKYYSSNEGKNFEKQICDFCSDLINKLTEE